MSYKASFSPFEVKVENDHFLCGDVKISCINNLISIKFFCEWGYSEWHDNDVEAFCLELCMEKPLTYGEIQVFLSNNIGDFFNTPASSVAYDGIIINHIFMNKERFDEL